MQYKIYAKYVLYLISLILFFYLLLTPTHRLFRSLPYLSEPELNQTIEADELNVFLNLWSRLIRSPLSSELYQRSLNSTNEYSPKIIKWLDLNDWNVKRFFYDEERLLQLIKCAEISEKYNNNRKVFSSGRVVMKDTMKMQELQLDLCKFDIYELSLIKNNLFQIKEIFAGRAEISGPKQ